ncbi:hypothetical protein ANCDUO_10300, partial [Ancylostoma duodenale]
LSTDLVSENVHLFKWLPQTDLLNHPKTKAFITHAGYNSVQEAIHAGIPMVCLALFGDQPKNAKVTEKLGISRNLKKSELTAETIAAAIREVLENERYDKNAKKLARMVRNKPVSPKDLLIRWTEFLAEFKTLENLTPAGNKLNWIQYHSIDVLSTDSLGKSIRLTLFNPKKNTMKQCSRRSLSTSNQATLIDLALLTVEKDNCEHVARNVFKIFFDIVLIKISAWVEYLQGRIHY